MSALQNGKDLCLYLLQWEKSKISGCEYLLAFHGGFANSRCRKMQCPYARVWTGWKNAYARHPTKTCGLLNPTYALAGKMAEVMPTCLGWPRPFHFHPIFQRLAFSTHLQSFHSPNRALIVYSYILQLYLTARFSVRRICLGWRFQVSPATDVGHRRGRPLEPSPSHRRQIHNHISHIRTLY